MLQGIWAGAAVALALGATAATAATGVDEVYAPEQPAEPSLNASAYGECVNDAPYVVYDVTRVDPDGRAASSEVTLVFEKGALRHEVALGALGDDGRLAGRVLWPAAAVDASGQGTDWPGWVRRDGEWVDVGEDDLGWTRAGAAITLVVNPEVPVAVSYPPATPFCAVGPAGSVAGSAAAAVAGDPPALAVTGPEIVAPLLLGAGMLTGGLAFATARRRPKV
ncbi:cell wall protein [Microbacterium sp. JZ31]|uniref:cell wall protein n=1 Tax=Microbacterium sp. JZ31 TaxID=1906274 RepID=UPI001932B963|nr:cell wall protein [Microbacterium sp. JZ31]